MIKEVISARKIPEINSENWNITTDGNYMNLFVQGLLKSGFLISDVNEIVNNSIKTLSNCPTKGPQVDRSTTGIVIGKIQSGKTSNFISLISLAFDNGYDIVTVFGGVKKILTSQNYERIKKSFPENSVEVILVDNVGTIDDNLILTLISKNIKIIFVTLKHNSKIDGLKDLYIRSKIGFNPVMIIDDEGDEYSLNTARKKHSAKSTINRSIINLRNVLPRHAYISVTATPQANLIISKFDEISPDFAVFVNPGTGYCGLETYHSNNSKYEITIDPDEPLVTESESTPNSLNEAIHIFLVGCAITRLKYGTRKKLSMLVHPSREVYDLEVINRMVDIALSKIRTILSNPKDYSFEDNIETFRPAYEELMKSADSEVSFGDIVNELPSVIEDCRNHIVHNKKSLDELNFKYINYNIFIGGDMLGRGITIENLAVSYITRRAKGLSNVDTVQQRARWFGYRKNVLDLSRIYATKEIFKDLNLIKEHESDLWSRIGLSVDEGLSVKEISRIFKLDPSLRLTRTSVGKATRYKYSLWSTNHYFETDSVRSNRINLLIDSYYKSHEDEIIIDDSIVEERPNHLLKNILFKNFLSEVLREYIAGSESGLNYTSLKWLDERLSDSGVTALCDVVWMRFGNESYSDIDGDYANNYQQGARKGYGGDKSYPQEEKIQIQIHNLVDRKTKMKNYMIAIYIPGSYSDKIFDLVTSEDF